MNMQLTTSCLTHVNKNTEMTFSTVDEALVQAEIFTNLGFEVDGPKSFDGESYTITVTP